ncbi:MAG: ATP-binding protein [Synergistaceae bacterium]|nr:ATP-binding protein [Synergistaceae bacterium]
MNKYVVLSHLLDLYPNVDEKVFYTDYAGDIHDEIIGARAIYEEIFNMSCCFDCTGKKCSLPEGIKARNSRVITKICESPKGYKYLDVRRTCGLCCKFDRLKGAFGRLYKNSGLKLDDLDKTFENYICGDNADLRAAFCEAFQAAKNNSCLVIAGKRGTGKTHLAISIAIENMKKGLQAKFRLVNSMLDELRNAVLNTGDYFNLMDEFKSVDCLILDDLGKEKNTAAGMDYLHQIIDCRYRNNLQTIITTNAMTASDLSTQSGVDFIAPIISRIAEKGRWITIKNADDYRVKFKKGLN